MKKYFDGSKGMSSSRNIDIGSKRGKNSTQLLNISSTSRNKPNIGMINNYTTAVQSKRQFKPSLGSSQNLFAPRGKTKDAKKSNLVHAAQNRRTGQRNKGSVEHLSSYKSNLTNKSEERESRLKQATCRSNANLSDIQGRLASSTSRKSVPKQKSKVVSSVVRPKPLTKSKKHSEFLEKANLIAQKQPDSKLNMNFLKQIKDKKMTFKHLFDQTNNKNRIFVVDDETEKQKAMV